MKYLLLFSALSLLCINLSSQAWTYSKGGDAFDGEYRTSTVTGKSDDATYNKPIFVVNNFANTDRFNVYLGNVGYFCDNVRIRIKFDGSNIIYTANINATNKQETVFIESIDYVDSKSNRIVLGKFEYLEMIQSKSKMYLRLDDDCDVLNIEFSLSGSTKAINYVYGEKAGFIAAKLKRDKDLKDKEIAQQQAKKDFVSGEGLIQLEPGSKYASVWDTPNYNGNIILKIFKSDTVMVLTRIEDHYLIKVGDTLTGYCNQDFITPLIR